MTGEELNQYDALSEEGKMRYKWAKSRHPNWSHKQIMCYIAVISESTLSGDDIIMGGMPGDESLWDKIQNIFR